jgi:TonB family protein
MIVPLLLLLTASPAPGPAPTADPCNHPARATYISPPVYPRGHYTNKRVEVVLRIQIAPDGTIDGGGVATSSGDAAFDGAAIQAAELSRFEPKVADCHPVAGTYLFKVTFMPH